MDRTFVHNVLSIMTITREQSRKGLRDKMIMTGAVRPCLFDDIRAIIN